MTRQLASGTKDLGGGGACFAGSPLYVQDVAGDACVPCAACCTLRASRSSRRWWGTGYAGDDPFNPQRVESFSFVAPLGEALMFVMTASGWKLDLPRGPCSA